MSMNDITKARTKLLYTLNIDQIIALLEDILVELKKAD